MSSLYLERLKFVCQDNKWSMGELVDAIESGLVQEELHRQINHNRSDPMPNDTATINTRIGGASAEPPKSDKADFANSQDDVNGNPAGLPGLIDRGELRMARIAITHTIEPPFDEYVCRVCPSSCIVQVPPHTKPGVCAMFRSLDRLHRFTLQRKVSVHIKEGEPNVD